MTREASLRASRLQVTSAFDEVNRLFLERGWSDGLPIVPPTEERVAAMVDVVGLPPEEVLGVMPPGDGVVTVEKAAANAVMAGAMPQHMPVVLAAVRAALHPEYNVGGVAATTAGAAPLIVVNGPVAGRLGVNGDTACFGSGYQSNAVIGRSLALVVRNLGGARPGEMEKSTQAQPAKYTFCIAENEAQSPWTPFHAGRGYRPDDNTVTLAAVRAFHQITETTVEFGAEVLQTVADSMKVLGVVSYYIQGRDCQVLLVLCPEHAQEIAAAGYSKQDVQEYLYQHCRLPKRGLLGRSHYGERTWPDWIEEADDDYLVPMVARREDILVMVAGGAGRHSSWMPLWSATRAVTEPVA